MATATLTAAEIIRAHDAAIGARHVHDPQTLVVNGTLSGLGLNGTFRTWQEGDRERRDDMLGSRVQRDLRIGGREYVQNADGDVRELRGLLMRDAHTEDLIDSNMLASNLQFVTVVGRTKLDTGRDVWQLRVAPPGGEPFLVSFDATTWMIDEEAYIEGDSAQKIDYDDYRVVDGALVPYVVSESSGDRQYDVVSRVTGVSVDHPIDPAIFAPLQGPTVDLATPVTVKLREHAGLLFVPVSIHGHQFMFLIDTGSQSVVLDPKTADTLGIVPQGKLEVRGARRVEALGVVDLDGIDVGAAHLPLRVATVVSLGGIADSEIPMDGILGYPFFAAAEVRIDPDKLEMTIAKPGSLPPVGKALPVETDRSLPEVEGQLNGVSGRFVVDTGNAYDLLVFGPFSDAHPGLVQYAGGGEVNNRGVGGSNSAVSAIVSELDIGPFKMFNRYTNVILESAGAFADRNDAGNIGHGVLDNFVMTLDLSNAQIYLDRARDFDDGRYRPIYESIPKP
ncbi:MAG: aspartyl protease family protein [Vulcanimicrobiaceae bacterium]